MKTGIVLEGGGMKCAWSAGLLDAMEDADLQFDYSVGVSAGIANFITFLAGQRGRNQRFYTTYSKAYMGLSSFLRSGSFFDLGQVYGTMIRADGIDPLDFQAALENPTEWWACCTDAETAEPVYFSKQDMAQDDYRVLMATCALPVATQCVQLGGRYYYDGGVAEPLPVQRALDDGCDRLMIVLADPRGTVKQPQGLRRIYRTALRHNPELVQAIDTRHLRHRRAVALAEQLEREGRAVIAAPSRRVGTGVFSTGNAGKEALYHLAFEDFPEIDRRWEAILK